MPMTPSTAVSLRASAHHAGTPGLLEFPDELLLAICAYLDTRTLFLFLQVNRRLHHTCLPTCFTRLGIKNGPGRHIKFTLGETPKYDEEGEGTGCIDVLSLLNIAFHVKQVERLACHVVVPAGPDITGAFRDLARLEQWVRRLGGLKNVQLSFDNDSCYCCLPHDAQLDEDSDWFREEWLEGWTVRMGGLMGALVEKTAEVVKVQGGKYLSHLHVYRHVRSGRGHLPKPAATPLESLRSLLKGRKERKTIMPQVLVEPLAVLYGEHWEFKRAREALGGASYVIPVPQPLAHTNSELRHLNIQSIMFLMPPLLQWTVSTLQYSNIQKLTLDNLTINHKVWPCIFALISSAAPNLAELELKKLRQITATDLLHFLGRLPRLKILSIGRDVDSYDSYDLCPFPDLPELISLHAPANWIYKLLSAHRQGLECLETLHIAYRLRNDGLSHWSQVSTAPSIPGLLQAQKRPLTVAVEVVMGGSPGWRMFEDFNGIQCGQVAPNPDVALISSMTLIVSEEFARDDLRLWSVLPRWLALFTALKHLRVNGHNGWVDEEGTLGALAEAVDMAGLKLVTLELNGKAAVMGSRKITPA